MIEFIKWYQGPDRYYHNLDHIKNCLRRYHEVRTLLVDPQAVWMAIWFHDCVYSTQPNAKNEELSAVESRRWVKDETRHRLVTNLILVTKHSDLYPPMTTDECFMCDIDLTSLGAHPIQFAVNNTNIRKEYWHYEDSVYYEGRIAILGTFLERAKKGKLYYTAYFRERYQEQAIVNLTMEISDLQNRLKIILLQKEILRSTGMVF